MKFAILVFSGGCLLTLSSAGALAQGWPPWADNIFRSPRSEPWVDPEPRSRQRLAPLVQDGGARPELLAEPPPVVAFAHDYPANSIVIDTGARRLYYVLEGQQAYAYPISVGREGFNWSGSETVSRKQPWPDWHPPPEMRERDPALPEKMTGGLRNPLGAMAIYLGNTLYRIHGTNDVKSIGRAQSSGCFRMLNSAVLHLASLTEIGAAVVVVPSLEGQVNVSRAPEPSGPRPAATSAKQDQLPDYRALREQSLGRRQPVDQQ